MSNSDVPITDLIDLRKQAGLSQTEAAKRCGLAGSQSRKSLSDWELGKVIPEKSWRTRFIGYLWDDLGLRKRPEEFVRVWNILVERWVWDPIDDAEWRSFTNVEPPWLRESAAAPPAAGHEKTYTIFTQLQADPRSPRQPVVNMAQRPANFVDRPKEYEQIISDLLAGGSGPVAITATLRGAGGFGKTTLAQAICHDDRIRAAFPDGILWATIGDDDAKVLPALGSIYHCLSGQVVQFVTEQDAAVQFSALLGDRRCLIVVDDVWHARHLTPFLQGGPRCSYLVTTRMAGVVPNTAMVTTVDAMSNKQAAKLLGRDLPTTDEGLLDGLAAQLGEWPILLTIVNRRLYEDVVRGDLSLPKAAADIRAELGEFGLTAFDIGNEQDRSRAVGACIGASLRHLRPDALYGRHVIDEIARFQELAVFPEDVAVPIAAVSVLWQQTGGLSELAAQKLCQRLAELSLIMHYDRQAQTVLLHDVVRRYLIDRAGPDLCRTWQRSLVEGYRMRCSGEWWCLPDDCYVYRHLLWHMRETGQSDMLEQLLQTYRWLSAKLQATDIVSTITDFNMRCDTDRHTQLSLLQHALQLSVSALARDKKQLATQLYGRLANLGISWVPFIGEIEAHEGAAWLRPRPPRLTPPGGNLLYTLSGHLEGVWHMLLAPGGRLITACGGLNDGRDRTVKVWDIANGMLLHSLEGHTAGVSKLLLAPDDRLITACHIGGDSTVKVWDIANGTLLHSLEGHTAGVSHMLLAPDGRLIAACVGDRTVKVWNIASGMLLHSLEGHTDGVSQMLLAPDDRLITACGGLDYGGDSTDRTVKVWDIASGMLLHSLEGHTAGVWHLLLAPDGRLVTACHSHADSTVRVWDIASGMLLHSLEGHTAGVSELLLGEAGRLITACHSNADSTVRVWDIASGMLLHSLEGHTARVSELLLAPAGRLITACGGFRDNTVKVWDIASGTLLHSLEGHTARVSRLLLAPGGRLITACGLYLGESRDSTVKVWDIASGTLLHSLEGHTAGVWHLLLAPDGRLITACNCGDDHTAKVWDTQHGTLLHSLEGHTTNVSKLLLAPDGRLTTACGGFRRDCTVKVWDIANSTLLHSLEGHTASVSELLLAPNDRLITACHSDADRTVKVWDIASGTLLHSLAGYTPHGPPMLLAEAGRLITACHVGGDSTVAVWDIASGTLLHSLEGHAASVSELVLAPDDRLITAWGGFRDRTVKVWDIASGTLLHSLEGHTAGVSRLLLAPDDRIITACHIGGDNTVKVWDIASGMLLHSLEGHTAGVSELLLAPGSRLVTACHSGGDRTVKVWDLASGMLLHSLEGHTAGVSELLLAPGSRLVTACHSDADRTVKVWDIASGMLLHSLEGHTAHVSQMLLAEDDRLITACGGFRDRTVKVWDIASGTLLHSLEGHTAGVSRLLLAPDDRIITACDNDDDARDFTVKVWDIANGILLHSMEGHEEPVRLLVPEDTFDVLAICIGDTVTLWYLSNYERIAQFTADGRITSCLLARDGSLVLGDGLGLVHFLTLVGYPPGAAAKNV